MQRGSPTTAWLLMVVALAAASSTRAETPAAPEAEWLRLQARAGVVWRSGAQAWPGPGLDYSGWTPADLALGGQVFQGGRFGLGAFLSVQREGFSLLEGGQLLTSGALWRVSLGPAVRYAHPRIELDAGLGYGLAQLPYFDNPSAPQLEALSRHGLVARLGARVPLFPGVQLHARAEAPITFAMESPTAPGHDVLGLTVGGALAVAVGQVQDTRLRALLSYDAVFDSWRLGGPAASGQTLQRVGFSLEAAWGGAAPLPTGADSPVVEESPRSLAVLRLRITRAEDGLPLSGARARVGEREAVSDAAGLVVLDALAPGALSLAVEADTFRTSEEVLTLVPGQTLELEVALQPGTSHEPAIVSGQVRSAGTGRSLEAQLVVSGMPLPVRTDASGRFEVELAAGTYRVEISADGHLTQRKELKVGPGERAILNVDLHPRRR